MHFNAVAADWDEEVIRLVVMTDGLETQSKCIERTITTAATSSWISFALSLCFPQPLSLPNRHKESNIHSETFGNTWNNYHQFFVLSQVKVKVLLCCLLLIMIGKNNIFWLLMSHTPTTAITKQANWIINKGSGGGSQAEEEQRKSTAATGEVSIPKCNYFCFACQMLVFVVVLL